MLKSVEPRTLEQMKNRPTSYEIVICVNGEELRIAFIQRKTERNIRKALNAVMNDDLEFMLLGALTEDEANSSYTYNRSTGRLILGKNLWIGASGKTERDLAA